jgi:hypothetical protein
MRAIPRQTTEPQQQGVNHFHWAQGSNSFCLTETTRNSVAGKTFSSSLTETTFSKHALFRSERGHISGTTTFSNKTAINGICIKNNLHGIKVGIKCVDDYIMVQMMFLIIVYKWIE